MGREAQDDYEGFVDSNLELLHTQVNYLSNYCLGLKISLMVYFCWNYFDFSPLWVLLQALALSACTTLVSVEPKLTVETRNLVLKV
jgi:hypothetical protein